MRSLWVAFVVAVFCVLCSDNSWSGELSYEFNGQCDTNCATGLEEYGTIGAITGTFSFGDVTPETYSGGCGTYCWSEFNIQSLTFTFGNRTVTKSDIYIAVGGTSPTVNHPFAALNDQGELVGGQGIRIDPVNTTARGGHDVISIGPTTAQIQFYPFGQGAETMFGSGTWTMHYVANTFELSADTVGNGTVTAAPAGIDCGADCQQDYAEDTAVTLSATPDSGWKFTGWSGACTGTEDCQVTMDADKSVTANFETLIRVIHIFQADINAPHMDYGDTFNPDAPTIVLTHGWQPNSSSPPVNTTPPEDPSNSAFPLNDLLTEIRDLLELEEQSANIITYSWAGAHTGSFFKYDDAAVQAVLAGVPLGEHLRAILGTGYNKPLHMIGHSLGTAVNASATKFLPKVDQVTILDSPSDFLVSAGKFELNFTAEWFQKAMPPSRVKYVDNFFGNGSEAKCMSPPTLQAAGVGTLIEGAAPDGGHLFANACHSDVHQIHYAHIIHEGDWYSVARNDSPLPPPQPFTWSPPSVLVYNSGELNNLQNWQAVEGTVEFVTQNIGGQDHDGIRLVESSPAAVALDVTIPSKTTQLTFDVAQLVASDGDSLQLYLGDRLIWEMASDALLVGELIPVSVPVNSDTALTDSLKFVLNSTGAANARYFVTNFGLLGLTDSDGDLVPDEADNCPLLSNADQLDGDNDGKGDVCDDDGAIAGLIGLLQLLLDDAP